MANSPTFAFGAPGSEPRWTHSAKEGIGTAYNSNSRVWFTLSHGIVNEIYWPNVDTPNTRDFQFLITDGESFCHEEKRDLTHEIDYPEQSCLLYRLTNTDPAGRYRLVKEVCSDPHRPVVLMHTRLEVYDEALRAPGKLKVFALLAPHMAGRGAGNSGFAWEVDALPLLHATGGGAHLVMGCDTGFSRRSAGFVGASDGWQDLMENFQMNWEFAAAEQGNIALTGEIDLTSALTNGAAEFMLALGFGDSRQSAGTVMLQSLSTTFEEHRDGFVRQWKRAAISEEFNYEAETGDGGSLYRLSRCVLLAHEDKAFEGALIASLSTPWGETKGDDDLGGYHLVWTRDMVQSATALLATGQTRTPLRALIWLACIQEAEGGFPQNSWIDGRAYWSGVQLDEVAAPMLLAWRLRRAGALQRFDPWPMIADAAAYLVKQGPVTAQERWEENSGYSASTLATMIAGLVCAAEFAALQRGGAGVAEFVLSYADWLACHVEDWTVAQRGDLVPGKPRYYVRITPADPSRPDPHPEVDALEVQIANGGGRHPARDVVGGDFLQLVRLGIRAAADPIVIDSLAVIDRVLRFDLPQGPSWRRYSYDGYGQKEDGGAFDGTGVGRCWPILTGERAHYELAAGGDPRPLRRALELFANEGGMLPEQVWDGPALEDSRLKPGAPTGSAMPLCWAHAEYISLVRSLHDGVVFDRIEPAYQRYVVAPGPNRFEMWTLRQRTRRVAAGRTLRVIVAAEAIVRWTADEWKTPNETEAGASGLPSLWFADLPTRDLPAGAVVEFTFFWREEARWEGENFRVQIV
ncbi:MAG: glycoside hydrolase family 15 protein [Chthoniobacterales bacterium]